MLLRGAPWGPPSSSHTASSFRPSRRWLGIRRRSFTSLSRTMVTCADPPTSFLLWRPRLRTSLAPLASSSAIGLSFGDPVPQTLVHRNGGRRDGFRERVWILHHPPHWVLLARRPGAWRRGGGSEAGGRSFW